MKKRIVIWASVIGLAIAGITAGGASAVNDPGDGGSCQAAYGYSLCVGQCTWQNVGAVIGSGSGWYYQCNGSGRVDYVSGGNRTSLNWE